MQRRLCWADWKGKGKSPARVLLMYCYFKGREKMPYCLGALRSNLREFAQSSDRRELLPSNVILRGDGWKRPRYWVPRHMRSIGSNYENSLWWAGVHSNLASWFFDAVPSYHAEAGSSQGGMYIYSKSLKLEQLNRELVSLLSACFACKMRDFGPQKLENTSATNVCLEVVV